MKRLRLFRRPAMVAAPAPVDPRDLCAVLTCTCRWTVTRHGFGLCDEHEAERAGIATGHPVGVS